MVTIDDSWEPFCGRHPFCFHAETSMSHPAGPAPPAPIMGTSAVVEDAFALFENLDLSSLSPFFGTAGQEYEGQYAYIPISEDPFSGDFRDPSNMNPSSWFGTPFLTDCSTTTSPGIHPPIPSRSDADSSHAVPPPYDRAPVDIAASYQAVAGGVVGAAAIWHCSAVLSAPLKPKVKLTRKLTADAPHGSQADTLYQDSAAAASSAGVCEAQNLVESHDPTDVCVRCLQGQRHSSNSLRRVTTNLGERVQANLPFLMSILSSSDLRDRLTEVGHDDEAIAKWLKAIHQKPGRYADRLPYITIGALIHKKCQDCVSLLLRTLPDAPKEAAAPTKKLRSTYDTTGIETTFSTKYSDPRSTAISAIRR